MYFFVSILIMDIKCGIMYLGRERDLEVCVCVCVFIIEMLVKRCMYYLFDLFIYIGWLCI